MLQIKYIDLFKKPNENESNLLLEEIKSKED